MTTKPKVDNKWVEEKLKGFDFWWREFASYYFDLGTNDPDDITNVKNAKEYAKEKFETTITQTQQDTLQWCLDEVFSKIPGKYDPVNSLLDTREAIEEAILTIKKRMGRLE